MNPRLKTLVAAMAVLALVAYVGTFFAYALAFVDVPKGALFLEAAKQNPAIDYIWTSASVLVGSVVAVALGQPEKPRTLGLSADDLVVWYGWTYAAVGTLAIGLWIYGSWIGSGRDGNPDVPLLIRNAATTFVGLVVPVVSAFLKGSKQQG